MSFKEIQKSLFITVKVEQRFTFQPFQLTILLLKFVSYIDKDSSQFMYVGYKLHKRHTSCIIHVVIYPCMIQSKQCNMKNFRTNLFQEDGNDVSMAVVQVLIMLLGFEYGSSAWVSRVFNLTILQIKLQIKMFKMLMRNLCHKP